MKISTASFQTERSSRRNWCITGTRNVGPGTIHAQIGALEILPGGSTKRVPVPRSALESRNFDIDRVLTRIAFS